MLTLRRVRSALRRQRASWRVEREDCFAATSAASAQYVLVLNSDAIAHKWFYQKTNRLLRPITPQKRRWVPESTRSYSRRSVFVAATWWSSSTAGLGVYRPSEANIGALVRRGVPDHLDKWPLATFRP